VKFREIDWVQIFVPQSGGSVFSFVDSLGLKDLGGWHRPAHRMLLDLRGGYAKITAKSEAAI
jgi:hypothetical protein